MKKLNRIFSFVLAVCVMLSSMPTEAFAAFHHTPRTYEISGVNHQYYIYEYEHTKVCDGCYDNIETAPHADSDSNGLCDVCNATVNFVGNEWEHIHSTSQPNYIHMDPYGHMNQCSGCTGVFGTHTTMNGPSCDDCGWSGPVIGKGGGVTCTHPNTAFEIHEKNHEEYCLDCPGRHPEIDHTDDDMNNFCDVCNAPVTTTNNGVLHLQHVFTSNTYGVESMGHYLICDLCGGNDAPVPHTNMNNANECDDCHVSVVLIGSDVVHKHTAASIPQIERNAHMAVCSECKSGYWEPHSPKMNGNQYDYAVDASNHSYICQVCDAPYNAVPHDDSNNSQHLCDACGFDMSSSIQSCSHQNVTYTVAENDHIMRCLDCQSYSVSGAHSDLIDGNKKCDECDATIDANNVHRHTYGSWVANGNSGHTGYCSGCRMSLTDGHIDNDDGICDICNFTLYNNTCAHDQGFSGFEILDTAHIPLCAICGEIFPPRGGAHTDTNPADGKCDECLATIAGNGKHEHQPDANNWRDLDGQNHRTNCVECGADIDGQHADDPANRDGLCDICGYGTPINQNCPHTTVNLVTDVLVHEKICARCNTPVGADPHMDTNPADGKCDDCGATVDSNNEHTHIPGTTWVPNNSTNDHESRCTECATGIVHDPHNDTNPADGTCDICGGILNGQGGGNPPQGCSHKDIWIRAGQTSHQEVCANCGTGFNTASHRDNDNDSHCDDCYGRLELSGGQLIHNHTPHPNGWYADAEYHFYRCDTCGMTPFDNAKHINNDNDTACDICHVTLDSANHHDCTAVGLTSWQAEDESVHYLRCKECNNRLKDENHSNTGSDDKCDKCNATLDSNDVHIHQPKGNWESNGHTEHSGECSECEAWLTMAHNDNGNGVCADCGYIINCQHPVSNQWMNTNEETHQLHCGDCGDVLDVEYPHENDGNGKCKDCGVSVNGQNVHKHNWSTAWKAEGAGHSHGCTDTSCTQTTMSFAHTDADSDNACDDCGDTNTQNWCVGHKHDGSHYANEDGIHYKVCERCQSIMDNGDNCADTDMDEKCDVCDMSFEHNMSDEMIEYNGGHASYCHDCGKVVPNSYGPHKPATDGRYISVDNAHHANYCIECGLGITAVKVPHQDTDGDNVCDDCEVPVDANGIHTHNKVINVIKQKVHVERCDECGLTVSQSIHVDTDSNSKCDVCTAPLNADNQHIHKEKYTFANNSKHTVHCEDCSQLLYGEEHIDANGDSVCEICHGTIENVNVVIDATQLSSIKANIQAAIEKAIQQNDITEMKKFFTAPDRDLEEFAKEYKENILDENNADFNLRLMKVTLPLSEALNDPETMVYFDRAAAAVQNSKADAIFVMDILAQIMYNDGGDYGMSADKLVGTSYDYILTIDAEDVATNRTWYVVASYDDGATFEKIAESAKGGNTVSFTTDNYYAYFAVTYADEAVQPTTTPAPAPTAPSTTPSTPTATPAPTPSAPAATPVPSTTPEAEAEMPATADTSVIDAVASQGAVQAVKDKVTVTDDVAKIDADAMQAVVDATAEGDAVVIPVAEATDDTVNQAVIDTQALADIADNGDDVVIQFTDGTVKLDAAALQAVVDQADGSNIEIHIETTKTEELTDTQKKSLENMDTSIVVSVQIFSDGKYIGDFKGGNATVMIEFTPEEGKSADDYKVYYVGEDGQLKAVPAKYENGYMVFTTVHFSDYVIAYEGSVMGDETVVQPQTPADDKGSLGGLPILGAVFALILVIVTMMKKRKVEE